MMYAEELKSVFQSALIEGGVEYTLKALVDSSRAKICQSPLSSELDAHVLKFKMGDHLQILNGHLPSPRNEDWLIGRVISLENQHYTYNQYCWWTKSKIGLIPSGKPKGVTNDPKKLEEETGAIDKKAYQKVENHPRPIVFLGPSTKKSKLTEYFQKQFIDLIEQELSDICEIVSESKYRQRTTFEKLSVLDCKVSLPRELQDIDPIFIYFKVCSTKVLKKLFKDLADLGEITFQQRVAQMVGARALYDSQWENPSPFSLTLTCGGGDQAKAKQKLKDFLMQYRKVSQTQ